MIIIITILQAMYLETPVIAVNDGGPLESVKDSETGFLLPQDSDKWADKMKILYENKVIRKKFG